jgi:hypothetical protein
MHPDFIDTIAADDYVAPLDAHIINTTRSAGDTVQHRHPTHPVIDALCWGASVAAIAVSMLWIFGLNT